MKLLNNQHKIFSKTEAEELAKDLNSDECDGWTYVVEPNPNPNGPDTAIIKVFDEDGEFVNNL